MLLARSRGSLAAALLALGASGPAQSDEAKRIEDVPLEALLSPVSGASKYEQPQEQAPASVTVVSGDEIERYGYRTLGEVLRSMAGVFTTNDRNYSYLALRGFGVPGDYSSRALLLVDGHRYNDPIYNTAAIGGEFGIDMELVDRVELIRGPGSSLYGSNAFLGVLNVVTRGGRDDRGLSASVGVGSLGSYRARLAYGDQLGGERGLELRLSASYQQSDGAPFLYFRELDAPETLNGIARGLDGEKAARFFASLAFRGLGVQAAFALRRKLVPTAAFGTVFGDPRFYTLDASGFAVLSYHGWLPGKVEVTARASFSRYAYEGEYPYARTTGVTVNRDEVTGSWLGAELMLGRSFLERLKLSLGAELRHELEQDQRNLDLEPRLLYLDSHKSTTTIGVFGQADWQIVRGRLNLSAGLRYDLYAGEIGGSFNPRAALIFTPPTRTVVKLLFGTAFRAPNAWERFYASGDPSAGDAQITNPAIRPETIRTHELVLEQTVARHLRATLSGYYYRIDDLIRLVAVDALNNLSFTNVAQVDAFGGELAFEARGHGVLARGSYALQRTRDLATGAPLANSPTHLFKALLSLPLYRDRLYLSALVNYLTERRLVDGGTLPGHVTADVTLLARELPRGFTVSLSVRNLFGARFSDPGGEEHLQRAIPQDGRTFFCEATYRPDWRR